MARHCDSTSLEELKRPSHATRYFPTSSKGLTGAIRRLMPNLKEAGIRVDLPDGARRIGKTVARIITLTNTNLEEPPEEGPTTHSPGGGVVVGVGL